VAAWLVETNVRGSARVTQQMEFFSFITGTMCHFSELVAILMVHKFVWKNHYFKAFHWMGGFQCLNEKLGLSMI
jgi:hypothetical protein